MSRQREVQSGASRRALRPLIAGALPLALAVACSDASGPQQAASAPIPGSAITQPAIPQSPTTQAPVPPVPGSDTAPSAGDRRIPRYSALQPGVSTAISGPAVSRPAPVQPGIVTEPPRPPVDYLVPENRRPIPAPTQAPPIVVQELHLPTPVAPVVPIAPPPRTLRLGDYTQPVPDTVPDHLLDPVNTTAANIEAAISTGGRSIGIDPGRADKIAAGIVAGAALGAVGAGVPAAIVGGVAGAAAGTFIGTVASTPVWITNPVIAITVGGTVGGVIGGVAGAAAVGIPFALGGAVAGGVAGGLLGASL